MKGLFLLTLKFWEEGTWLVYSPLSRCPANHQQQRSDLWWQAWLIPDPLYTLSLVRVSPYVQERSTRGWKFAAGSPKIWRLTYKEGTWRETCRTMKQGERTPRWDPVYRPVSDYDSLSYHTRRGFPLTLGWALGLFSLNTRDGKEEAKCVATEFCKARSKVENNGSK